MYFFYALCLEIIRRKKIRNDLLKIGKICCGEIFVACPTLINSLEKNTWKHIHRFILRINNTVPSFYDVEIEIL